MYIVQSKNKVNFDLSGDRDFVEELMQEFTFSVDNPIIKVLDIDFASKEVDRALRYEYKWVKPDKYILRGPGKSIATNR